LNFDIFKLHPSIMVGVQSLGYTTPTPIQEKAIPHVLQGADIIGLAQTGTGKTAAFVLPILQRLINEPRGKIGALVISPTRELAEQTHESFKQLGQRTGLRSMAIYGGVGMDAQVREIRRGVDIIVACPGRLLDHIWKGHIDFPAMKILVIDEADRLFDMGFLPDTRRILSCIIQKHQTLLFSATMPNDVRRLIDEILHDPVTIKIGNTAPAVTVSHELFPIKQHQKTDLLEEILHEIQSESVLVFTKTKFRAERVAQTLASRGYLTASLQGNLSQTRRQAALEKFRQGSVNVLVATDIAARGIDVSGISHVINYDMPDSTDSYIHRIGRTGRIGNKGQAFTFITDQDMTMVRELERILKTPLERRRLETFNYETPAPVNTPSRIPRPGPKKQQQPSIAKSLLIEKKKTPRRAHFASRNSRFKTSFNYAGAVHTKI